MWLPAGVFANPEDAASASLSGLCYLKFAGCKGLNLSHHHLSELILGQVEIQLGHYITQYFTKMLNSYCWFNN